MDSLSVQSILITSLLLAIYLVDNGLPTPFPLRNGKWEWKVEWTGSGA